MEEGSRIVNMPYAALATVVRRILLAFLLIVFHFSEISNGQFAAEESVNCTDALFQFAHQTAEFTNCAIMHARPIRLCEKCASNYTNVVGAYGEILERTDHSGVSCRNQLINVDRLEIIENGYMYVQNLWQNGHCDSCYENNGTTVGNLSNDTLKFQDLVGNVTRCIENHYVNETQKFEHSVCSDCSDNYAAMNEFYEYLKISQADKVCVDIIDSVNTTRSMWSQVLVCDKKEMKFDSQLIGAIIGVSILPLVFYVTTRYLTRQMGTRLTRQKRLVQTFSIHAPSTSR